MTLSEYMSPERFPLTSKKGYSVDDQFFMDAFNLDAMREAEELKEYNSRRGIPMPGEEFYARLAELEEKANYRPALIQEIIREEKAKKEAEEKAKREADAKKSAGPFTLTEEQKAGVFAEVRRLLAEQRNDSARSTQRDHEGNGSESHQ